MDERSNERSKLKGPQANLTGFLVPDSSDDEGAYAPPGFMSPSYADASPGFMSPSYAAASPGFSSPSYAAASPGFMSPGSASSQKNRCLHNLRKDTCKKCWKEYNDDRISKGFAPEARGIFCKHGINKFTKKKCAECNAYSGQDTMQFQQPTGVIPDSARMFEPPIPKSAGLSFSPLEASQVNPVNKNLFGPRVFYSSDEGEMGGGRRKYRKSSKKSKRKSSKKSKRKSSRKARKLTRR